MKLRYALLVTALFSISDVPAATLYVSPVSVNPVPPFADWRTAATNIQDAVNSASRGDLILVTNGLYQTGGRFVSGLFGNDATTNRLAVTKPVTVQSINGPAVTMLDGGAALRCAYLTNGATLIGFTLTNGNAGFGGGVYCTSDNASVSNCFIVNNQVHGNFEYVGPATGGGAFRGLLANCLIANNYGQHGGGASESNLRNCTLIGNSAYEGAGVLNCMVWNSRLLYNRADWNGGAGFSSTLNNCLVISNTAGVSGGGVCFGSLTNCTLAYNTAVLSYAGYGSGACGGQFSPVYLRDCIIYDNDGLNYDSWCVLNFCCTVPLRSSGGGNITNAPIFINPINGNFRLQTNSPCINAGNNIYAAGSTDLDGRPRIVGETLDMGAYEFQGLGVGEFIAWLEQYGLPTDGSVDHADLDGSGFNVYQDWLAGLNPTNALSVLAMLPPLATNNPLGLAITWESVNNRIYFLQSSTNLGMQPAFSTIQSNLVGQSGTTTFTDTSATNGGPYFYRVGVQQ